MKIFLVSTTALLFSLTIGSAGLFDQLGLGSHPTNQLSGPAASLASLSDGKVAEGLKEALGKGVQNAVSQLGHDDGFLTNLNVKIPIPEKLHTVEKTLRALKQDKLADDFVNTMNHAAEQAVPEAAGVFGDVVRNMSVEDARAILTGPNDAATQYFRKTTQTNLFEKFLPIVKTATEKTGVTSTYKQFMAKAGGTSPFGSFGGSFLKADDMDIDVYVTNKAMDGLFIMVAEEEKRIRENPVACTSELLQQVFGSVGK